MKFTKMNGLGNDYIFVDATKETIVNPAKASIALSDRHRGIGGDGLVLIDKSNRADFKMRIYNADGSEAETCGNALRCVGKYVYEKGLIDKPTFSIETKAGVVELHLGFNENTTISSVKVNLGICRMVNRFLQNVLTPVGVLTGYEVNIGNPHFVIFLEDFFPNIMEVGRVISNNKNLFPYGTNVEFAIIFNRRHIRMRVYERGSGETQACGSGAASVFFVANELKKVDNYVTVSLLGGDLICSRNDLSEIIIDGEAELNYEGEIFEGESLWQRLT